MPAAHSHERFATTRWSMISAAQGSSVTARRALADLCHAYWAPLYAFARRQGYHRADAEDLTQAFFADLLGEGFFSKADQNRGRFRGFLLTAFTRFATSAWRRDHAQKRGGAVRTLSLDFDRIEATSVGALETETAEMVFQRRWAMTVLENVARSLELEYALKGKEALFQRLSGAIIPAGETEQYDQIAADLQMTTGAVKVAAHRLRARYRELLRAEVAETVSSPEEIDDELRDLIAAFQRKGL